MARTKSLNSKVKSLVENFAAELLPLLRKRAEEEIAAQQAQLSLDFDSDEDDQENLVEVEIEVIPDTQRDPGADVSDDDDAVSIPETIYPT
jgi:hypothetical protein